MNYQSSYIERIKTSYLSQRTWNISIIIKEALAVFKTIIIVEIELCWNDFMIPNGYVNIINFSKLLPVLKTTFQKCLASLPICKHVSTEYRVSAPSERKQTHCFQIELLSCMSRECIFCAHHRLIRLYPIQHMAFKGHSCELFFQLSNSPENPTYINIEKSAI